MLEAHHYTAAAKEKGSYALPAEYDGVVNQGALYHAVRAFQNNQRQGTHATKTRGFVSGGNKKPWRQKGTGRARQGSTRAPHWPGGGTTFGPTPRSHHTDLPRKVRQLARRSALNARAQAGVIHVLEAFEFTAPKTQQLAELLAKLGLAGRSVLVLTAEANPHVYLSARNIPGVEVQRYRDASAYEVLRAEALVVEEAAIGGHVIAGTARKAAPRAKRAKQAESMRKPVVKRKAKPPARKPAAAKGAKSAKAAKAAKPSKKKGGSDA
jgi:large subunit ribosomal protein L4